MIPTHSADMDPEQFRKYGHQLVDWIAEYLSHPERYNVLAQVQPGEIRAAFPPVPPEKPEAIEDVIDDLTRIIAPGLTHWNHPGFFAYFGITASGPGILADLLSAAFNTNAMLWRTGPAAVELEVVVLGWLRQLLRLPDGLFGIINDTASVSTLVAIAAAREALDLGIREQGMAGRPDLPQLRLYTSDQAHSSVEKGAIVLGIGRDGVCKIPVD
jgi:aromatic-L-amino-acid decarboxylase